MSDATTESLSRAFQLIETENLSEARSVLEPLLTSQSNNPDVWWLYAYAVEDTSAAQTALNKLYDLDPDYPGAKELRSKLADQLTGVNQSVRPLSKIQPLGSMDKSIEPDDIDFDEFDDFDEFTTDAMEDDLEDLDIEEDNRVNEPDSKRRTLLMRLTFLVILVLVALIVFGIITGQGGDDGKEGTPTASAQVAGQSTATIIIPTVPLAFEETLELTPEATLTEENATIQAAEVTPEIEITLTQEVATTEEALTLEPEMTNQVELTPETTQEIANNQNDILSAFNDFQLATPPLETINTDLGSTTIVAICAEQGISKRQVLNDALFSYAEASTNTVTPPDAIGVRLADCVQETTINVVAVSFADVENFLNGSLSQDLFIAKWRAVAHR